MGLFYAGQKLRASDLNNAFSTYAVKATTLTVNNSTAYVNDPELVIPLVANSSWIVETTLYYVTLAAAGAKANLTVPTGATMTYGNDSLSLTATTTANAIDRGLVFAGGGGHGLGGAGLANPVASYPRAFVVIGSTAGNLQFQFAQATANASNTQLMPGSFMRLTRTA
jgi:hypothetical protein